MCILADSYNVNQNNIYAREWVDANGKTHKHLLRTKISGKCKLKIDGRGISYDAFVNMLKSNDLGNGRVHMTVYVNNTCETKSICAFYNFSPTVYKSLVAKSYKEFDFSIEEE